MWEGGRREFLAGAAGAGLALATGATAQTPRPRVAFPPPRRADLEQVEHVVILMQENISFDHYFGTLPGVRGFSDPKALELANGHSVFEQPYPLTPDGFLRPWRFDPSQANPCKVLVDNSWASRHRAFNGGRMDGFVRATSGTPNYFTMAYYQRSDLAWHMALADAFTVCDGYHCSVLGPTNPNRLYLWTGMIDPHGRHGGPDNDNQSYQNGHPPLTWKTYPERLQKAGISWRVYHEEDDFDDNALKYFKAYQDSKPGQPLYENAMRNRPADAFERDVAAGRLPQVSWIVAPTKVSEHPAVSAPGLGADYCARIFDALRRSPAWKRTVFILTYDEDGGYFDHVRPPTPPAGTKDEFIGTEPIGLGFRVPTVVCSPWTRGGNVCSLTYDHTSLIRFLERRFGVHEPNLSAWRRRTCGDLWECFDFSSRRLDVPRLPATSAGSAAAAARCANGTIAAPRVLNGPQPAQERGERHRRPCASAARPVTINVPKHARSGVLLLTGRRARRLTARELRTGRVVVGGLPAGRTVRARVTLHVRNGKRLRTVHVDRTLRPTCAA